MKRSMIALLVVVSLSFVGAKGQSCSAEIDPGDGSAASWSTGAIPVANGPTQPMTCAWLEENNCWKRLVAKGMACAAGSDRGTFAADRKSCAFPSGAKWEFDGDVNTPGPSETHIPIMNWRLLRSDGDACMTGKVLGVGRSMIDVEGETALFESLNLTQYRVTCPDGSSFSNESTHSPGDAGTEDGAASDGGSQSGSAVCATFGASWLAKKAPGILIACEGSAKSCALELWGGPTGPAIATRCGW
jgi:hypothetical protein